MLYRYKEFSPKIAENCFIAPSADVIGEVEIDSGSSIWFNASLRGDLSGIKIGKNTNIQDNCVLHTSKKDPVEIGDNVVIAHNSIVHGARVESNTMIAMGAVLLNGVNIGKNCIVGAGSVVMEGTEIPDNSIVLGTPAKVVKEVSQEHIARIKRNVQEYQELNNEYLDSKNFKRLD
jgi:carbonic anhydrase/acetyltransferase-like protein (isoleucine patch superfamily)